jgi:pyruvate kinase
VSFDETNVVCVVVHGGRLGEHKGINLPGVAVSAPSLTEKDRDDLRFGVAHDVDYVALSFVRTPQDVLDARAYLQQLQEEFNHTDDSSPIPLIAKIEKPEAVQHLDAILAVVDGAMVARGDLGVEMALEKVPLIQKRIIAKCNALGLPVITATQMLESMVTNPRPTRAEVNDVANAVIDQTDGVMLSAETSVGAYPIESVEVMVRIAQEIELSNHATQQPQRNHISRSQAVSDAARALAEETSVKAIVVLTRSGLSAQLISKDRPRTPIFAYTPSTHVYRRLPLWWGVWSYLVSMSGTTEELIALVEKRLLDEQLVQKGDHVVIMGGLPIESRARTNFVKLHRIEGDV